MSKPRIHYLNMGPFPVFVGFTTSPADFHHEMKRLDVADPPSSHLGRESANATTHYLTSPNNKLTCIIVMPPHKRNGATREQYASLLAHEALHVVQEMRSELNQNEPFCRETESYLVQQIVQECLQIAWKTNRVRSTAPK